MPLNLFNCSNQLQVACVNPWDLGEVIGRLQKMKANSYSSLYDVYGWCLDDYIAQNFQGLRILKKWYFFKL